uniref:Methyltransferase domain-containing protein n=1 Tax=Panagrolaimus sp. JU765 TaxID=591449 RepID=A0AC34RI49_9BILA
MAEIIEIDFSGIKVKRQSDLFVSELVAKNQKKFEKELATIDKSDLDPHVYEGGLKVWECAYDLADYLKNLDFTGKTVLELGCGSALPSIVAAKKGATKVVCQDYNQSVIELVTKPNLEANSISDYEVWATSWENWAKTNKKKFDVILTSETIYDASDYQSLHDAMDSSLSTDGEVILAAKMVYFGKTGDYFRFLDFVEARNVFEVVKTVQIEATVKRIIAVLKRKG